MRERSNSSKVQSELDGSVAVVCYMCGERVPNDFFIQPGAILMASWRCAVCGCDRVVISENFSDDYARKIALLKTNAAELAAKMGRLERLARDHGFMLAEGAIAGRVMNDADMEAQILRAFQVAGVSMLPHYIARYSAAAFESIEDVAREHRASEVHE